jgi:hypothetical protein
MPEAGSKNPSFVLQKPGEVTFEDRPVPEIKDAHDVIIRVNFTGICGSDVCPHFLERTFLNAPLGALLARRQDWRFYFTETNGSWP